MNNADLTVVWLDLANAYGPIPHKVIEVSVKKHHIPDHIKDMVAFNQWRKDDFMAEVRTGCTISVVLFLIGMNFIIEATKRETRGPKKTSRVYHQI